jgi:hypothetical protein
MHRADVVCLFLFLAPISSFSQSPSVAGPNSGLTIKHPVGSLQAEAKNHHGILITYDRLPLAFDANQGQTDARVKFLSHSGGKSLFLTQDEAVLVLPTGKRDRRQWRVFHCLPTLRMQPTVDTGLSRQWARTKRLTALVAAYSG